MTLWLVRAGRHGEREQFALENQCAVVGWEEVPDLSLIHVRSELTDLLAQVYPGEKQKTRNNWESQLWPFIQVMEVGDLVALPLKSRSVIALGKIQGNYQHQPDNPPDARHTRPVEWLKEIPRSAFDQDILYSLGAFMTVCRIRRNNAEVRVGALLGGTPMPTSAPYAPEDDAVDDDAGVPDLAQIARDQISAHISQKFRGHELTRLVGALLQAQGYQIRISPPGADGGVDIIAGQGPLGFDAPRLIVQVKSSDTPADVSVLRELQGVMKNFRADHGLLVSWGGFKSSVEKESAQLYFEIRRWDDADLVTMLQTNYDKLPEDIQAELPLKRIWVLVPDED